MQIITRLPSARSATGPSTTTHRWFSIPILNTRTRIYPANTSRMHPMIGRDGDNGISKYRRCG
jgi:hypothetical protein